VNRHGTRYSAGLTGREGMGGAMARRNEGGAQCVLA
jgi:hypothetical protein